MNKRLRIMSLVPSLGLLLIFSGAAIGCASAPPVYDSTIVGKWMIKQMSNGTEITSQLFDFQADGTLLFGNPNQGSVRMMKWVADKGQGYEWDPSNDAAVNTYKTAQAISNPLGSILGTTSNAGRIPFAYALHGDQLVLNLSGNVFNLFRMP